ncbi:MAG: flagellar hook-basal body complex protein FliE [Acidobacteriota bacterium]|nr:flagellar hook-basal body complex protein FliE [Acidobacteriota bacterium]
MAAPILPIAPAVLPEAVRPAGQAAGRGNFQDVLSSAVGTVEGAGRSAATSVENFLSGEGEDLHTTILATQRAELSFELFLQARNKVVSAYQEIMRMQM